MKHTWHECDCTEGPCVYCGGGLSSCDVCLGAEGSLPTDCPGEPMGKEREARVYAGEIDYREGRGWCVPDGTGTSMGDAARRRAEKEEASR